MQLSSQLKSWKCSDFHDTGSIIFLLVDVFPEPALHFLIKKFPEKLHLLY